MIGFYNGINDSNTYSIGRFTMDDNGVTVKTPSPVLSGTPSSWDAVHVTRPCPVIVGNQTYLYYQGYDGSGWRGIGLAIGDYNGENLVKYGTTPVIPNPNPSDPYGVVFPVVIYEPNYPDTTQKFKMWVCKESEIYYYYSQDGINWTSHGKVLSKGTDTWEANYLVPCNIMKVDDIYYLYYGGDQVGGNSWQGGLCTFTDPKGTYTKSPNNPIFKHSRLSGGGTSLTASVSSGDSTITVNNTSGFHIGEAIWIFSSVGSTNFCLRKIASISNNIITLSTSIDKSFSSGALVRSILYNSANSTAVYRCTDGKFIAIGTAFQAMAEQGTGSHIMRETTFYATSDYPDKDWAYDYEISPPLHLGSDGTYGGSDWDTGSAENPTLLLSPIYSSEESTLNIMANSEIINIQLYPVKTNLSISMRINGKIFYANLVDTNNERASNIMINVNNSIKAIAKY